MAPDEKIETIDAFKRIPIIIESVFHISCSIIRFKKNNSEYEKNFLGEIGIFLFRLQKPIFIFPLQIAYKKLAPNVNIDTYKSIYAISVVDFLCLSTKISMLPSTDISTNPLFLHMYISHIQTDKTYIYLLKLKKQH